MKKPKSGKKLVGSKARVEEKGLLASCERASQSWVLSGARIRPTSSRKGAPQGPLARTLIWLPEISPIQELNFLGLQSWQMDLLAKAKPSLLSFSQDSGPLWIVKLSGLKESGLSSHYGLYREAMGSLVLQLLASQAYRLEVDLLRASDEAVLGALVGLDLAAYSYLRVQRQSFPLKVELEVLRQGKKLSSSLIQQASDLSRAVNLSRHLVNLPPNQLHPQSFAQVALKLFKNRPDVQVELWDTARLKREQMGLFVAVGSSAPHPPCMLRIKYRPKSKGRGSQGLQQPLAFVGKGITFDSGGLNLKPGTNMRLMKKDMGGAASVIGLAYWACLSGLKRPMDFYLALAENSVDQNSFRPSDILKSRSGLEVEIHNTDAEGRLVLADTLDVAVTQKGGDEPAVVIDVATLTGAIKAGLGVDLAGLFSNSEDLTQALMASSLQSGDLCWPMPLHQKYRASMRSTVADMTNAVDGFGGAITAALFLESFVKGKPWAHLDIYAWKDGAEGAHTESGASGQAVQLLADFSQKYKGA